MKRVLSIAVIIMLTLCLFVGCGEDKNTTSADTNSQSDGGFAVSTEDVTFVDANGESKYRIIRSEKAASEITTCTSYLFKQIKSKLGVLIKNASDVEDGTDTYEILVGDTNRPESQQALDYLKNKTGGLYDDFIICSVGKKIVINGFNSDSIDKACKYFIENFFKAEGIKGGIEYLYAAEGNFETVTVNGVDISEYTFVKPQYNTSYLTQLELEKLQQTVYQKTGFMIAIERENDAKSDYEIIVGNSTRDGVEIISDHDTFSVNITGKKIYLNGGSAHATAMAVSEFAKLLKGDIKDQKVTGSYNSTIGTYDLSNTLHYVWGDEFDGADLDTTKWKQETESYTALGVNGKTSVRSSDPDDVFLSDGKFYICAREDDKYYYGGMIQTPNKMCFKYGYAETSALVPHGDGFWVAFWTVDAGLMSDRIDPDLMPYYTPEIDIMEMFGNSATYAANMHSWPTQRAKAEGLEHTSLDGTKYGNAKKYHCPDGKKLNDDFHTYGMIWDDKHMGFTCDGIEYFSYDTTTNDYDRECFNRHMTLIFSMATGFATSADSKISTDPDEWQNSNKLIADYINLYQCRDGYSSLMTGVYK